MGSRTADAQEPVCVPFLRGSVCFEGLELATWTKDVFVKGLLGALPQRVSGLCPGCHQLLQFLLLGLGTREEVDFYSTVPNLLERFNLSYLAQANKASSRSSAVKFLVCHSGGGLTLFTLHVRVNLFLIHRV